MPTRSDKDALELDNLIRQGEAAARVGDRAEAEALLRRATAEYPYNEAAWLALAGVVEDLAEKRTILQRVQHINPASEEARLGLERIASKLGPAPADTAEDAVEAVPCVCGSGKTTLLRCSKCGKPICPDCSIRTPVGLRCKECAAVRKSPIYSLSARDVLVAGVVGLALSTIAAIIGGSLGGFLGFFTFFVGLAAGGFVADLMSRAVRYKRGVGMQILAVVCLVLGAAVLFFLPRGVFGAIGLRPGFNIFYLIAAIAAAIGRLR